jgi:hypothetical protein
MAALALAAVLGVARWWPDPSPRPGLPNQVWPAEPSLALRIHAPDTEGQPDGRPRPTIPSPWEKSAWVGRIQRDYDEIRAKASSDFAALAAAFPGGLNAYLRQLALIEREKRRDLAAVLSARELEQLEFRETPAGHVVQELLGSSGATAEQMRGAFHLQLAFEDRFSPAFDSSPPALLERERARHETQEKIRGLLGDDLFTTWLRGEGPEHGHVAEFMAQQGLPAALALGLWRTKNEFTLRRLELAAQSGQSPEESRAAWSALVEQTRTRVLALLGPRAMQAAGHEVLGWLPGR